MPGLTEGAEDDRISWPCPPTLLAIESLESSNQNYCGDGDRSTQEITALSPGSNVNLDGNPRTSWPLPPSQESLSVIATQLLSPVLESVEKRADSDCDARTALTQELNQPSLISESIFPEQPSKEQIQVDMAHGGLPQVVSKPVRPLPPLPSSPKAISPMEQSSLHASKQQSPQKPPIPDHSDTPKLNLNDDAISTPSKIADPDDSLFNRVNDAIKVVIVGDGAVGKACMAHRYVTGEFPEGYVPTVFDTKNANVKIGKNDHKISIWLTAGQDDYDRLRPLCYPKTDVFLICFGINSPASFSNITEKWIPEIQNHCPDTPFVLVGLKTDLRNDPKTIRELKRQNQKPVTREMGVKLAKEINAQNYVECSSLNRTGLENVFIQAVLSEFKQPSLLLSEPIFPVKPSKEEIQVDIVGDALIGKTCLVYTYATGIFPKGTTSLEPDMKVLASVQLGKNAYTTNIQVHADDYFPTQRLLTERVFLLCFSVAWPNSIRSVFEKFVPELKLRHPQTPVIVVGLQTDLRNDRETQLRLENLQQKPVTKKIGKEIAKQIGAVKYVECSALTRAGLTKVFEQAVKAVVSPRDLQKKHKCSQM